MSSRNGAGQNSTNESTRSLIFFFAVHLLAPDGRGNWSNSTVRCVKPTQATMPKMFLLRSGMALTMSATARDNSTCDGPACGYVGISDQR